MEFRGAPTRLILLAHVFFRTQWLWRLVDHELLSTVHLHRRRNSKSRRRSQPRPPCGWSVLSGKFVAWLLKLLHEICSAHGGQVATLIQTSVPWCMTWHPLWTLNLESWLVNPGVLLRRRALCASASTEAEEWSCHQFWKIYQQLEYSRIYQIGSDSSLGTREFFDSLLIDMLMWWTPPSRWRPFLVRLAFIASHVTRVGICK